MSETKKIVTRFAPSPTGFMHVGSVRTALFAWVFAQKNKGTFILRIEDTDKEREVAGSTEQIIASLKWMGINWDEGPDIGGPHAPYLQSQRLDTYKKYAQDLADKGLAYADPYTETEIEAFRAKAQEEKRPFLYRDHRPENPPQWDGSKPLRLKIADIKTSTWTDVVRGELSAGPEALDDFILMKSDGYPTYNFAHIIDDLFMGTTHIFRADEFISSTPKFLALYEALGIEHPAFVTLPPIMGADGKKKLGKRDGAKDILGYRDDGYLADALFNFLAFIGWNPGDEREIMSREEIIEAFDIGKIQTGGGKFNEEKLLWLNKEYIKRLPEGARAQKIKEQVLKVFPIISEDIFKRALSVIVERISYFGEIPVLMAEGDFRFFFERPQYVTEKLLWKDDTDFSIPKNHLTYTLGVLERTELSVWGNMESLKATLWKYAEEKGKGSVLWPLRYSLSGREKSPDPFSLLYILGKEESLARIRSALGVL